MAHIKSDSLQTQKVSESQAGFRLQQPLHEIPRRWRNIHVRWQDHCRTHATRSILIRRDLRRRIGRILQQLIITFAFNPSNRWHFDISLQFPTRLASSNMGVLVQSFSLFDFCLIKIYIKIIGQLTVFFFPSENRIDIAISCPIIAHFEKRRFSH